ncbi:MAG TPA: ion channel [Steroidobacteraceae bacterium]|nr:ion channel [Steroidobacteraceae bacterium]
MTAPLWSFISLLIVAVTGVLVVGCVLLHYETLRLLSLALLRMHAKRRRRIVFLVLALLALATAEIWLFGIGYYWLLSDPAYGALHGPGIKPDQLVDYVYFSAVIYSTLGLGDLVPSGSIRFLVGTQALVGFTLISWSAAFTFLEMERFWRDSTERRHRAAYGPDHDRQSGR